jgi:cytochrome P450
VNALARIPGLFGTVKNSPEAIPQLVEETMRWDAAAQGFVRTPNSDVEMHGKTIPSGAQVLVHIGAANRDEQQFPDAAAFVLDRSTKRHLGLGHSTHFCVGAPLGRQLAKISFEELLRVADRLEADFETAERVRTPNFRGFIRLEVEIRR